MSSRSIVTIEEVVDEIVDRRGVTPLKLGSDFKSTGYRVISAKSIKDRRVDLSADEERYVDAETFARWMKKPLKAGDVVLTSEAPLGEPAYVDRDVDWVLGQRLFGIRTNPNRMIGRYLYYALQTAPLRDDILSRATGSVAQGIRQSELRKAQCELPSLAEQRTVAHILGAIDDKIELNRQIAATLEKMARAIFKSWFVDFDPVRAKAEGRPTGLPDEIAALFPDSFEDSALGLIPCGWDLKSFADTVRITGGGTPKTGVEHYWRGHIPWYSVADAPRETQVWVVDTAKKVTEAGVAASATIVLPVGTTIISARGTVGRLALTGVPMAMNQSCYALADPRGGEGFFTYFSTLALVNDLKQRTHGSVFDTITRDTLSSVKVVIPQEPLRAEFDSIVTPSMKRLLATVNESNSLAATRDTLLPKLISGEVSVAG